MNVKRTREKRKKIYIYISIDKLILTKPLRRKKCLPIICMTVSISVFCILGWHENWEENFVKRTYWKKLKLPWSRKSWSMTFSWGRKCSYDEDKYWRSWYPWGHVAHSRSSCGRDVSQSPCPALICFLQRHTETLSYLQKYMP